MKKAWTRMTPEERKAFTPGKVVERFTREDAGRIIAEAYRKRMAPPRPKKKHLVGRIGDTFLQAMKMIAIMASGRRPSSKLKRR